MGPFTLLNPVILKRLKQLYGKLDDISQKVNQLKMISDPLWQGEHIDFFNSHIDLYFLFDLNGHVISFPYVGQTFKVRFHSPDGSQLWEKDSPGTFRGGAVKNGVFYGVFNRGYQSSIISIDTQGNTTQIGTINQAVGHGFLDIENNGDMKFYANGKIFNSDGSVLSEGYSFDNPSYISSTGKALEITRYNIGNLEDQTLIKISNLERKTSRVFPVNIRLYLTVPVNLVDEGLVVLGGIGEILTITTKRVVNKNKLDEWVERAWNF